MAGKVEGEDVAGRMWLVQAESEDLPGQRNQGSATESLISRVGSLIIRPGGYQQCGLRQGGNLRQLPRPLRACGWWQEGPRLSLGVMIADCECGQDRAGERRGGSIGRRL